MNKTQNWKESLPLLLFLALVGAFFAGGFYIIRHPPPCPVPSGTPTTIHVPDRRVQEYLERCGFQPAPDSIRRYASYYYRYSDRLWVEVTGSSLRVAHTHPARW